MVFSPSSCPLIIIKINDWKEKEKKSNNWRPHQSLIDANSNESCKLNGYILSIFIKYQCVHQFNDYCCQTFWQQITSAHNPLLKPNKGGTEGLKIECDLIIYTSVYYYVCQSHLSYSPSSFRNKTTSTDDNLQSKYIIPKVLA